MKGNNTITLNVATMVQAMQFWLDSQFAEGCSPKVVHVCRGTGVTDIFEVRVAEREAEDEA